VGNYISRLFQFIKQGALWSFSDQGSLVDMFEEEFEKDWAALLLLSDIYSLHLITTDDDEFYGPKNPIQIRDLVPLSAILKNMAFWFLWTSMNWESVPLSKIVESPEQLAERIAQLCRHIYARDSRRSFCPLNHWHIASSNTLLTFTQSLLKTPDWEDSLHNDRIIRAKKVLQVVPFVIPFELRVKLLRAFVLEDRRANDLDSSFVHPEARITVHRASIFEDGFAHLNALGSKLKGKIAITFISEHGLPEAGIDGGGVFKEFLTALSAQAFNPNYGLFFATKDQLLYPCPHSYATNGTFDLIKPNRPAVVTFFILGSNDW
jgi:ubiquitin-protein ligase E3 C